MVWIALLVVLFVSFLCNLYIGAVDLTFSQVTDILLGNADPASPESYIVLSSRLPAAIAATLGGGGLAVAGLLMQTAFRNPLAGPSIMGINAGASLGVAIVMLLMGGMLSTSVVTLGSEMSVVVGALIGSFAVMAILILMARLLKNDLMLLIAGILIGYLASSFITLLNFSATSQGIQNYVMWGMGTFQNIPMSRIVIFAILVIAGLLLAFSLMKPLDTLLLGDEYAVNLGINIARVKQTLLLATGILAAVVTAYCGPVAFIGLAVPHIARLLVNTDLHRRLLPMTLLAGCIISLWCNIICVVPCSGLVSWFTSASILPLNAVTPLFGVPVILYVLIKRPTASN